MQILTFLHSRIAGENPTKNVYLFAETHISSIVHRAHKVRKLITSTLNTEIYIFVSFLQILEIKVI